MTENDQSALPVMEGTEWFWLAEQIADRAGSDTDDMIVNAGKKLPVTADRLGNVVSHLYRVACCYWGCSGGDHVGEWLAGRIVNQANAAYRLVRAASYDEALMLVRSIGEAANLLWVFFHDDLEFQAWKTADRKARMKDFGPAAIRKKIEKITGMGFIEADRYQRLCEIGTHPVPGNRPGHYSGGRPILAGIVQEAGVLVCINEMALAISIAGVGLSQICRLPDQQAKYLRNECRELLSSKGGVDIMTYEEAVAARF